MANLPPLTPELQYLLRSGHLPQRGSRREHWAVPGTGNDYHANVPIDDRVLPSNILKQTFDSFVDVETRLDEVQKSSNHVYAFSQQVVQERDVLRVHVIELENALSLCGDKLLKTEETCELLYAKIHVLEQEQRERLGQNEQTKLWRDPGNETSDLPQLLLLEIEQLKADRRGYQQTIEDLRRSAIPKYDTLFSEMEKLKDECRIYQETIEDLRRRNAASESLLSEANRQLNDERRKNQRAIEDLGRIAAPREMEKMKYQGMIEDLQQRNAAYESILSEVNEQSNDARRRHQKEIEDLRRIASSTQIERKRYEDLIEELRSSNEEEKKRVKVLEEEQSELEKVAILQQGLIDLRNNLQEEADSCD